jgi:hypothetical protein
MENLGSKRIALRIFLTKSEVVDKDKLPSVGSGDGRGLHVCDSNPLNPTTLDLDTTIPTQPKLIRIADRTQGSSTTSTQGFNNRYSSSFQIQRNRTGKPAIPSG